jgi:NNP family nitrate/nitrite transporter-like MFS transporter
MDQRATRLQLLNFSTIPLRAFHLTWMAFFVCFFAWFAVAPLMPAIRAATRCCRRRACTGAQR